MRWKCLFVLGAVCSAGWLCGPARAETVDVPAEVLRDKIRGGLLGQILGNLNGLPHEMKYIAEPGNVTDYTPALPDGARTDDDTDFEWVYIYVMQAEDRLLLPPQRISRLWKARINQRIWCSNQYARQLMDLGLDPPLTGMSVLNPWADFNISGQFICETFGLIAPGMPQTAAQIGLNYTTVTIDGEPAQTTQLFTTMIALAFLTDDIEAILDGGLAAIDADSKVRRIVEDVRRWHRKHPADWKATRKLLKEKYSKHGGAMRDRNGYELNTGATIAALLYGGGDFVPTLIAAFNFGWDADNTAATAGTIVGVTRGYRWMLARDWHIVDRYRNTTRQNMPHDATITSFADRLVDLAEKVIGDNDGQRITRGAAPMYRIQTQPPRCVQPLADADEQAARLQAELRPAIERDVAEGGSDERIARAAYLAICLDLADSVSRQHPQPWRRAVEALNRCENVLQALFHHSPTPAGEALRAKALAAGVKKPPTKKPLW